MKKIAITLFILIILVTSSSVVLISSLKSHGNNIYDSNIYSQNVFFNSNHEFISIENRENINYQVYIESILTNSFEKFEDAIYYASSYDRAAVLQTQSRRWVWDNYPLFNVIIGNRYEEFDLFHKAVKYARNYENSYVVHRPNQAIIWSNSTQLSENVRLNVPNILQMPALPRGCEVTALAILLNHAGVNVDKMTLANQVSKNYTPREVINGVIHWGHPNYGFVGDMFNRNYPGLGVYYKPIFELMKEYLPNASINLTGSNFEDLLFLLNRGIPIWVITNATYNLLSDSDFVTWITPQGEIQITAWLHAVVVSGYDENNIYFSDPLGRRTYAPRDQFIAAWEQMGRQAIAYAF